MRNRVFANRFKWFKITVLKTENTVTSRLLTGLERHTKNDAYINC